MDDFKWLADAVEVMNKQRIDRKKRLAAFTWDDGTVIFPCREMARSEFEKEYPIDLLRFSGDISLFAREP